MSLLETGNSAALLMMLCCKAQLQALLSVAGPCLTALDYRRSAVLYWQIPHTIPQTDTAQDTISFPGALRDMDY